MKGLRRARAAEQIRRDLADLIDSEVDDPSMPSVRLTKVELAPDYSYAKVLLVPADRDAQEIDDETRFLGPLHRASGYLRSLLADRIDLRRVPKLDFKLDRGAQNASRVEDLLDRLAKRRKEPLAAILLAVSLLTGSVQAGEREPQLERYEASASVMGSEMRIALYGARRGPLASAAVAAFDEARRIDRLISNYRPDSEWSRINEQAGGGPVKASAETIELLQECLAYSRLSEGVFDVTVGSLVEAWGFFRGSGELPGGFRLRRALESTGYRRLEVDSQEGTVRFAANGLALDPGGIGKGYAVERVAELLRGYGVESALISAGTSTLYAIGSPPDQPEGWPVEIREPRDAAKTAARVLLRDSSLSTSGSYEKFFEVDGKTYSHIFDPRTGRPAQGAMSVSVLAASSLDSEAWSTALFVNGKEWAEQSTPQGLRVFFCDESAHCGWLKSPTAR